MPKAYSFINDDETDERHIFEGNFSGNSCTAPDKSICKKTTKNEGSWKTSEMCLDEDKARKKAAEIGRDVCGICVSHLYTTY